MGCISRFLLPIRKSVSTITSSSSPVSSFRHQCQDDTDAFYMKEDQRDLWMLVKKFRQPIIFVFTIFLGWDDPITLAARVALFLLSTRPNPSLIYLFVEQVTASYFTWKLVICGNVEVQEVEVQDYKLLCIARVEVGYQKLNVLRILGGWWVLPSSWSIFSLVREWCSRMAFMKLS